jgi:ParB family chromosome partitioning protein
MAMAKKHNGNLVDLELTVLTPNPSNPRKYFDEAALKELADSIKSVGILQPIVVRPMADGFEIVCGERRYRASKLAKQKTIPCIVKDLDDSAALQAMITENLQRRDVSPLEEADAYLMMKNNLRFTQVQIASKLGISPGYVARRLMLTTLIEPWRKALDLKGIDIGIAIEISKVGQDVQQALLEDFEDSSWNFKTVVLAKNHIERNYTGLLNDAEFDIEDATLTVAGSCIGCPHNTASHTLLFDDLTDARCLKVSCFKDKKETAFKQLIDSAVSEDSNISLGVISYFMDYPIVKEIQKKSVVIELDNYSEVIKPEAPDLPIKSDEDSDEDFQEMMEDYEDELRGYQRELEEYNEEMQRDDLIKVIPLVGSDKGRIQYYYPRAGHAVKKAALDPVEQEEISIKEKIKRADELVDEKAFSDLIKLARDNKYDQLETDLRASDKIALMFVLLDNLGYLHSHDIYELIGLDRGQFYKPASIEKWQAAQALEETVINRIIRSFISHSIMTGDPKLVKGRVAMLKQLMHVYYEEEYKEIIAPLVSKAEAKKKQLQKKLEEVKQ